VYSKGDLVLVKSTFFSDPMIGVVIDVDPEPSVRLKYLILVRGMNRMLWYMETEIRGHAINANEI
jgi:hypothetical protein